MWWSPIFLYFKCECDGILIRAFELTGLCCGQPGAPNFVVQRLCLQVQVAAPGEVLSDGWWLGEFLLVSVLDHVHIRGCIFMCCTLCVFGIPWCTLAGECDVYISVGQDVYILVLLHGCNDIYVREGVHSVIFNYRRRLVICISECWMMFCFFSKIYFEKIGALQFGIRA